MASEKDGSQHANDCSTADLDESLMSFERLDRTSPDLWPEQIPGVSDFAGNIAAGNSPPKWLAAVDKPDVDMLHEFGSLSPAQLMEKVRGLQELSFQLGLEEAHEMVRAKFINIFSQAPQGQPSTTKNG